MTGVRLHPQGTVVNDEIMHSIRFGVKSDSVDIHLIKSSMNTKDVLEYVIVEHYSYSVPAWSCVCGRQYSNGIFLSGNDELE